MYKNMASQGAVPSGYMTSGQRPVWITMILQLLLSMTIAMPDSVIMKERPGW